MTGASEGPASRDAGGDPATSEPGQPDAPNHGLPAAEPETSSTGSLPLHDEPPTPTPSAPGGLTDGARRHIAPDGPAAGGGQPGTSAAWEHTSPPGWPEPPAHWYAGQAPLHAGAPHAQVLGSPAQAMPQYAPYQQPGQPAHYAAPPQHRRPGWGALVGVAAAAAIVAGGLGGVAGGYLASNGYLDPSGGSSYEAPAPQPGSTSRPADSIAGIAAKALPSVVTIQVKGADGTGTGSGFVFDRQGHLITNNHVVAEARDAGEIKVVLANGRHVTAKLVGRDRSYDVAVLKVDVSGLTPLPIGSSAAVVVGDQVIAVGAPLGLESTVTSGIVSALNRPVSPSGGTGQSFINAIQTDAAINPGNSGGPLLDMQGRVVGVNSAIAAVPGSSSQQSGSIGVGFSIPSDQMRKTAEQLIRTGKAVHPVIGVILDTDYTGEGVRIATEAPNGSAPITKNGPADKAGIRPGDVVVEFEGRPMTDPDELVVAIRARSVGDVVTMTVRRGSREINVKMTLQGASD